MTRVRSVVQAAAVVVGVGAASMFALPTSPASAAVSHCGADITSDTAAQASCNFISSPSSVRVVLTCHKISGSGSRVLDGPWVSTSGALSKDHCLITEYAQDATYQVANP